MANKKFLKISIKTLDKLISLWYNTINDKKGCSLAKAIAPKYFNNKEKYMNDLIYKVDRKTGTTECIVQNCKRDFMRMTEKILSQYSVPIRIFYTFITAQYCDLNIEDEYVGKSVCSPEDTFNARYGRDIARTKAIIKREAAYESALWKINEVINTLSEVNRFTSREYVLKKHIDNMNVLLEEGKSLSEIYGYNKDNCEENYDDSKLQSEFTPHCCSLCGTKALNYFDDYEYRANESLWHQIYLPSGKIIDICNECFGGIINE